MLRRPPVSNSPATPFPYTTLSRAAAALNAGDASRFRRVLEFSVLLDLLGAGIGLVVVLLTVAPAMRLLGLPAEMQALAPYYGASILFLTSVGTSHGEIGRAHV